MQNQSNSQLKKFVRWPILLTLLIVINIAALVYLFLGFGYIKIDKPDTAITFLNENNMGNKSSLLLRPGSYTIRISGSGLSTKTYNVKVYPFVTKKVTAESTTPIDIFKESSATPYFGDEYTLIDSKFLNNDWLVAKYERVNNGNVITVAFRFVYDKWNTIVYYPNNDSDIPLTTQLSQLPDDVASVFNEMKAINDED